MNSRSIRTSAEVRGALRNGEPVVALESCVITHGLPFPENLNTARLIESTVRDNGAVPATIAVLGGELRVGLSSDELEQLASTKDAHKLSRRDLPVAVALSRDGGTTVAATMCVAAMANLRVFATGGIGGVHRGQPFDVSADLPELERSPIAVVCAGAKAILDLPLTLEWLETHGVPVVGYQTDELPAFYSRRSGLSVDCRVDTAREAARIIKAKWDLGLGGGVLIAVPVPVEHELSGRDVESAIGQALVEAERQGIRGRNLTPYLLRRVAELTGGESISANVALLCNNAAVGAQVSRELCVIEAPAVRGIPA